MNERLENILLGDVWSKTDVEILDQACQSDSGLSELVRLWTNVSASVGIRFRDALPEPRLLVLCALAESEFSDTLTTEEMSLVSELRLKIDSSPAKDSINLILNRIGNDAEFFNESWQETQAPVRATEARPIQADRSPLRRVFFPAPRVKWGYGIAAALAVTIVATVLLRPGTSPVERFTYRAEAGQTHVVNLPDGSTVRLVDGSEFSHAVDPAGFDRQIILDGKAFFDVAHGAAEFNVTTSNAVVRVYGTSFGIATNSTGSITEVVLVSGSVRLEMSGDTESSVLLAPGQYSRVLNDEAPLEPASVNLDQALFWTDLFIFRETTLSRAAERLSESFAVRITVSEDVAGRTVTGTFAREQGIGSILEAIAAALDVVVEEGDTGEFHIAE